jgi:hypothetical protein
MQERYKPVQPGEVVLALSWLEQGPREDIDAHEVDSRLVHERHILRPDILGPLFGVVVPAVANGMDAGQPSIGRQSR